MTRDEFIQKAKEIHGNKYDYSQLDDIISYKNKIKIICHKKDENNIEHGEFYQRHYDHLNGCGCKKCMGENYQKTRSFTTDEFIQKAKEIHGNKYDYSKVVYKNIKTKICIICPIHGEIWQEPQSHLNGRGCWKCVRKVHNKDSFVDICNKLHNFKYDYSKVEYIDYEKPVCIICPKHGEFWQKPHEHRNGRGCPKCGIESTRMLQLSTTDEFIQKAKEIHGNKYDYSKVEYNGANNQVCIICPKHGEFWQKPHYHLLNNGCKYCKESRCEKQIRVLLEMNNIEFIYQANKYNSNLDYLDKMSIDFYLPAYNIGIECQGRQHFEPINHFGGKKTFEIQQKNDKKKKELCQKNGLKLLYFYTDERCKKYINENDTSSFFNKNEKILNEIYGTK